VAPNGSTPANYSEAINRAYNLVVATVLGITGLAFGSDLLGEAEVFDKLDDSLLAALGLIAVIWYFVDRNWAKRSSVPLLLAGLAFVVQIGGFVIEFGDPTAVGDDFPGILVFLPLLIIVAVLYALNGRYLVEGPSTSGGTPIRTEPA
jgi:peptidoglycan/LPS O-acetylase OafA/YrhL